MEGRKKMEEKMMGEGRGRDRGKEDRRRREGGKRENEC